MKEKYSKSHIIFLILAILSGLSLIYGIFRFWLGRNNIFLIVSGISLLIFIISLNIYSKLKEINVYNEYGVRKDRSKFKLKEQNRELVETSALMESEKILSQSQINYQTHEGSWSPEEDLESLIGLIPIKEKIQEFIARAEFETSSKLSYENFKSQSWHMMFSGPPGTGKTTVARIISGLFYKYGYLNENKVIEITGNDLINGIDCNQKIKMYIKAAKNKVLFIDEAYSLKNNPAALATFVAELENNRSDFICILAGYDKDMQEMLKVNTGLPSRIAFYINFPRYTEVELLEIAVSMLFQSGYKITKNALNLLNTLISQKKENSDWGEGRSVRKILEEIKNRHAINYKNKKILKKDKYIIQAIDIF